MEIPPPAQLHQVASSAITVGVDLSRLAGLVPDATPEISQVVNRLYDLSTTILKFEEAVKEYKYDLDCWHDPDFVELLRAVLKSSTKSLRDLDKAVVKVELTCHSKLGSFKRVWKDVNKTLLEEGSSRGRLEKSKERMSLLLALLHRSVNENAQPTKTRLQDYERRYIKNDFTTTAFPISIDIPDAPLPPKSPASPAASRRSKTSFGHRPPKYDSTKGYIPNLPPNPHIRPKTSFAPFRNSEFIQYVDPGDEPSEGSNSSQSSSDRYKAYYHPPQPTASRSNRRKSQPNLLKLNLNILEDEPLSPPPLFNSTSPTTRRSSMGRQEHWACSVYQGLDSETRFHSTVSIAFSECFGKHTETIRHPDETELMKLRFPPELTVRFWRNETTGRTRMACHTRRKTAPTRLSSSMDISYLSIRRNGSSLKLYHNEELWAVLSFGTMEDLVIFYTTFLVLRQLGPNAPRLGTDEIDLEDEELLFSGVISDDIGGRHFFRVLRDLHSGAVRVAASVKGGDSHELPVWTSFVTDSVHTKGWLNRHAARVRLKSLHLISFSDMYDTKIYTDWELLFMGRDDAKDFEQVFKNDLRRRLD